MEFIIGKTKMKKVCEILCNYNIPWDRILTDRILIIENTDLIRIQKEIPLEIRLSLPHKLFVACNQA
jgi:hypothetical protein